MSLTDDHETGDAAARANGMLAGPDVRPHLQSGLNLLLQAYEYAHDLQQDVWDLAVELSVLRAAGLNNSDLRWLAGKGYIAHAIEVTGVDDSVRRFRHVPLLTFVEGTSIVLTPAGLEASAQLLANGAVRARPATAGKSAGHSGLGPLPNWDQLRRQLRVGSEIVKEFKLPSPNQETVLAALEEEGWPPRIDDPLPPVSSIDSRRRLHDTIRALNRKQRIALIRFMGDGSGEGIRWEPNDCQLAHLGAEVHSSGQ